MAFSIVTLGIITLSIMTLSMIILGVMKHSIMNRITTFIIQDVFVTLSIKDTV
jgi:hypothetical protein